MIPSERNAQQAVAPPGPPLLRNETTDADNEGGGSSGVIVATGKRRNRWTTRTEDATRKRSAVPIDNMEYALLFLTQLVVRLGVSTLIIGNTELSTLSDFS